MPPSSFPVYPNAPAISQPSSANNRLSISNQGGFSPQSYQPPLPEQNYQPPAHDRFTNAPPPVQPYAAQPPYSSSPPSSSPYTHQQSGVTYSSDNLPPVKPVFGITLDELFRRDGSAVPMVVYQCIQAVELFGLDVEGIYRMSGNSNHVAKLKSMFDHGMALGSNPSQHHFSQPSSTPIIVQIIS